MWPLPQGGFALIYQSVEEVRASKITYLTPIQAAKLSGIDAQVLRIRAAKHPEKLNFPVLVIPGNGRLAGPRIRIPVEPFLHCIDTNEKAEGGVYEMNQLITDIINDPRATIPVATGAKVLGCSQTSMRAYFISHPELENEIYIVTGKQGKHMAILKNNFLLWLHYPVDVENSAA